MVIDKAQALDRLGGNLDLYLMLVNKFVGQYKQSAADVAKLIETDSKDEAANLVHSIKGAAGNLSMNDLFETAKSLEFKLRNNQATTADDIAQFNQALVDVSQAASEL